jgi:hypothetical protein
VRVRDGCLTKAIVSHALEFRSMRLLTHYYISSSCYATNKYSLHSLFVVVVDFFYLCLIIHLF